MPKLLVFTAHPAHIHQFKNLSYDLKKKGWDIVYVSTLKEVSKHLLDKFKFKYYILRRLDTKHILPKYFLIFENTLKSIKIIKKEKPTIIISRLSPYGSIASKITSTPHITFSDTETAGFYDKFFAKFVDVVITPNSFKTNFKNQIRIFSNKELSYLHPNIYQSNVNINKVLGVNNNEKYCLLRFVSMSAYHDKGRKALSQEMKLKMISEYSRYSKVFISSETELPEELLKYKLKIDPELIHNVLHFASLYVGESSTMAVESAILGTPAVFINDAQLGVIGELAKFNLLFPYTSSDQENAFQKGLELLKNDNIKIQSNYNKNKYLETKIDLTAFLVWFVENYPQSVKVMKETPEYQYNFK